MATTTKEAKHLTTVQRLAADRAAKKKTPMLAVRHRNRCLRCGRPRGYMRKFQLCRICFRQLSLAGEIPGVMKSSW
jgi:small subunit ribosomal protein S14